MRIRCRHGWSRMITDSHGYRRDTECALRTMDTLPRIHADCRGSIVATDLHGFMLILTDSHESRGTNDEGRVASAWPHAGSGIENGLSLIYSIGVAWTPRACAWYVKLLTVFLPLRGRPAERDEPGLPFTPPAQRDPWSSGERMRRDVITVGTRGSRLAIAQAQEVIGALRVAFPYLDFQIRVIRTAGDCGRALPPPGGSAQGVFVKEIEEELTRGRIDIAVHSLKDLPTEQPPGLRIAAVTKRADPFDALISRDGEELLDLEPAARVGTSSPRRAAMLLNVRPDLRIVPLRGNVETRLRKLREGACDALILAAAGIERLNLAGISFQRLAPPAFLPAPGQGCLALEARTGDPEALRMARRLTHYPSLWAAEVERAFLREMGGGCRTPLGAYASYDRSERTMRLFGCLLSPDGRQAVRGTMLRSIAKRAELAPALARRLKRRGGDTLADSNQ